MKVLVAKSSSMKTLNNKYFPMSKKKHRQLRISSKHYSSNYKVVPELRLAGDWFKALGFEIGTHVRITTREQLLIIEPIVAEEAAEYKAELKAVKRNLRKLL